MIPKELIDPYLLRLIKMSPSLLTIKKNKNYDPWLLEQGLKPGVGQRFFLEGFFVLGQMNESLSMLWDDIHPTPKRVKGAPENVIHFRAKGIYPCER